VLLLPQGYHNVGFHNPDQISPEIDALAASGVILEAMYTFKYCAPTRSSFLSGRFPIHVNQLLNNNPGGIDLRMTLLPQKLKSVGYKTATTGKWHCGARSVLNLPINRGFDSHFGFLGGGEDHYQDNGKKPVDLWRDHGPAYGENGTYSCELYSAEALRVVAEHDPKDPLFLYYAFQNTHEPYQCPTQYQDPGVDYAERRVVQGMLTCVSISIGNLTSALKAKGMWDNTLLVFSGDNGGPQYWGSNNYPLRGGKWTDFQVCINRCVLASSICFAYVIVIWCAHVNNPLCVHR
jgi:arylsulfatase B